MYDPKVNSLHEYKKFFDEAIVGLCRFDIKTGKLLMANEHFANMLGYSDAHTLLESGETLGKLCGKDEKNKLLGRLRKEGTVNGYEMKMSCNGQVVWVSAYIHINCDGTCIQGTIIDITYQKSVEFELEVMKTKQIMKLSNIKDKLENMINCFDD